MRRYKAFATGVIAVFAVIALLTSNSAQALSGIWTRGYQVGYFDLEYANHDCWRWTYGYQDCYLFPNGLYVGSVPQLMSFLESNYSSGNYQLYTSAAYVVHSMLGQPQGSTGRPVSAAQWTDLQNRLNYVNSYGGIHWHEWNSTSEDGGLDSASDVYIAHTGQADWSTVFYSPSGAKIYALFQPCGNPDGSLTNGLPNIDYNLTPTITGSPSVTEADNPVQIQPSVNNTGGTASTGVQWQVSTFTIPPGDSVPSAGTGGQNPNQYYGHGATTVNSGNTSFPRGVAQVGQGQQQLPDVPVGTKVCYALSVQPWNQNTGDWRYSTPFCVAIGKKPKVQVWGSDLSVGDGFTGGAGATSNITTSVTVKAGMSYGSWDEYAASATGTVTGFGSGAAYNNGLAGATTCTVSQLIFTNAGVSNCSAGTTLGKYASVQSIPNVAAAFPVGAGVPAFKDLGDAANKRAEPGSGTITINGGNLQKGQWLVLNAPTATVNITGNINYTNGTLHSLSDIPQLIIIANCINVSGGVTNIDAWLITQGQGGTSCDGVSGGGVLNTCSDVAPGGALASTVCSNTLQVNGPVMASHLYLQRTAGAGTGASTGDPAEIFNLRPDAYLWLLQRSAESGFVQAIQTTQLPPRF